MKSEDIIIILLLSLILIAILMKNDLYNFEYYNNEAIANLSSMYKDGKLIVTKLKADSIEVNSDIKVNGEIKSDNDTVVIGQNLHIKGDNFILNNDIPKLIKYVQIL